MFAPRPSAFAFVAALLTAGGPGAAPMRFLPLTEIAPPGPAQLWLAQAACPPGLAGKQPRCQPPGQASKQTGKAKPGLAVGDILDLRRAHIVKRPGLYGLSLPPDGHVYVVQDGKLLRVDQTTGKVLSILRGIDRLLD